MAGEREMSGRGERDEWQGGEREMSGRGERERDEWQGERER